jgi:hypothetical protein
MDFEFSGEIWFWRGPAPFYFITVPDEECGEIQSVAAMVTYGWGVIPVLAQVGGTEWKTSLFPKNGRYLVPLRKNVRTTEKLAEGDMATVRLTIEINI